MWSGGYDRSFGRVLERRLKGEMLSGEGAMKEILRRN
jgi:hypothetical protein